MRTCPRCGQRFEVYTADDRYDSRCAIEVKTLLAVEAKRARSRVWTARDETGRLPL